MGVQMFGQSSFESSQESACECVPKDSIRSHYETLLNEFYKRHAPSRRAGVMSSARVVAALVSAACFILEVVAVTRSIVVVGPKRGRQRIM